MAYVNQWLRSAPPSTATTATTGTVEVSGATVGNLLVGVFTLRAATSYVFSTPTNGWTVVSNTLDLAYNVRVIVCHKIAQGGSTADDFTLSWTLTGTPTARYWDAAVIEDNAVTSLTNYAQSAFVTTNVSTSVQTASCGTANTLSADGGIAIAILAVNDDIVNTTVGVSSGFTKRTSPDYSGVTVNFAPQVYIATTTADGTAAADYSPVWTWPTGAQQQNLGIVITYSKSAGAAIPDWTFTGGMTAAPNASGINSGAAGSSTGASTLAAVGGVAGTALAAPAGTAGTHTTRWWLKRTTGDLSGDIKLTLDGGATWSAALVKANITSTGFSEHIYTASTGAVIPKIGIQLTNTGGGANDSIIVGNSELYLGMTDAAALQGVSAIYTGSAAVTAQKASDVTYGGIITPNVTAPSWTAIPDNSRVYPMTEGTGTAMTQTGPSAEGSGTYSTADGWGATAGWEKAASLLENAARIVATIPPGIDIRIGATGQSNLGMAGLYLTPGSGPQTVDDNLWHYATDATNANNLGPLAWRVLNPLTQVPAAEIATMPVTGAGRTTLASATWYQTTNPAYAFARRLSALTGRRCRIINTYSNGTFIDGIGNSDPTVGWAYDPTVTTLCSTRFAADVRDAIADLPASQTADGDKLHFMIYHQGGSELLDNINNPTRVTSYARQFAHKLANYIEECYDPTKHNICDANTVTLVLGENPDVVNTNPSWDGWRMACSLIGDKAKYIQGPSKAVTIDTLHIDGPSAELYADAMIKAVASPSSAPMQADAAWNLYRNTTDHSAELWTYMANGTGAVAAFTEIRLTANSGAGFARISKREGFLGLAGSIWDRGLKNLRVNDVIQISTTNAVNTTNRRDITITGPIVNAGDYGTFPCNITEHGTPPTAGSSNVYFNSTKKLYNGDDLVAETTATPQIKTIARGKESVQYAPFNPALIVGEMGTQFATDFRRGYYDKNGRLIRHNLLPDIFWTFKTTNATATTASHYGFMGGLYRNEWTAEYVELEIFVKRNSDSVVSRGTVAFTAVNHSYGTTATITTTTTINKSTGGYFDNLTLPADFVAVSNYTAGTEGTWQAQFKGVAATDLSWTVIGRVRQLITTA